MNKREAKKRAVKYTVQMLREKIDTLAMQLAESDQDRVRIRTAVKELCKGLLDRHQIQEGELA